METTKQNEIHVHIDAAEVREGMPDYDQATLCPQCGGVTETSFGLAGGGFGIYSFCPSCGIVVSKSEVDE